MWAGKITCALAGMFLLFPAWAAGQDAAQIIQRSAAAVDRDWQAAPQYEYSETEKDKEGTKTYRVTVLSGSPYRRLIQINGKQLDAKQEAAEEKKFRDAVSERQQESSEQRDQRIAEYREERKRDHTLITQLTTAFDFRLVGTGDFDGHKVYLLKATPRNGYQPIDRDSKVLTGMEGSLWIDRDTFQWVKVEAHVIRPVSIEGFLAEVEPGTRFVLEKTPVTSDVWLRKHFVMTSSAKVLFLFSRKSQEDDTFFDYQRVKSH